MSLDVPGGGRHANFVLWLGSATPAFSWMSVSGDACFSSARREGASSRRFAVPATLLVWPGRYGALSVWRSGFGSSDILIFSPLAMLLRLAFGLVDRSVTGQS